MSPYYNPIGSPKEKWYKNWFLLCIIYPLLVVLFGTLLLKALKII
jgi:hypothetical protein